MVKREIKIQGQQEITGRGLIFIVDLVENGLAPNGMVDKIPFSTGDQVSVGDKIYMVRGVEAWRGMGDKFKTTIGLNVILVREAI